MQTYFYSDQLGTVLKGRAKLLHTEDEEEGQDSQYVSIAVVCTLTGPPGDSKEEEVLSLGGTFIPPAEVITPCEDHK